jgi:hypothetical protein
MRKKMDMRFGTWNVRSMYGAGSLRAVAEEISVKLGHFSLFISCAGTGKHK